MVYYRKYRPQKIEELDSEELREKLYLVLSSADVSHAFLFTGPKGLGKTSTARIVAKAVNCEKKNQELRIKNQEKKLHNSKFIIHDSSGIEPCNECDQCVSIANGTNLDILEIDGASNRGIDEIRDLRDKIKLSPISSRKKVYIIDEVHMLTTEAFNALLKTLEEPPKHAMFIFCTTEPHKLPQTIVSRCFHIQFKKATNEQLKRSLNRIIKGEDLKVSDEALSNIASFSDGSFRDGAKILEELALYSKGIITKETVEKKYHPPTGGQISNLVEFLTEKDTKEALGLVSKLADEGVDIKIFVEELISYLHEMLLVEVGVIDSLKFKVKSSKLEIGEIKRLIELLVKAHEEFKYAVLPQLPLELVIIEWSSFQFDESSIVSDRGPVSSIPPISARSAIAFGNNSLRAVGSLSSAATPAYKDTKIDNMWKELIEVVKKQNHSIAGFLRGCSLKNYNDKELVIEAKYKFHKDRLEDRKTIEILEKVCEEISGNKVKIKVELRNNFNS